MNLPPLQFHQALVVPRVHQGLTPGYLMGYPRPYPSKPLPFTEGEGYTPVKGRGCARVAGLPLVPGVLIKGWQQKKKAKAYIRDYKFML